MHDILMITHKRPYFTRLSLERLLASSDDQMRVWIWHNGDDAKTLSIVRSYERHPNFHQLHVSPENLRLREPTNWFWEKSDGSFLSKVDDDCLVPDGWGKTLRQALCDDPSLGVIGCWRFYDEDFLPDATKRKLRWTKGDHQLMVHPFVQGSSYVMRREVYMEFGPLRAAESFTGYCVRAACRGWSNGWYFPFLHEEHMDDPRSPYYVCKSDTDFCANIPLTARNFGVRSIEEYRDHCAGMARRIQEEILDPRDLTGIRNLFRKLVFRLTNLGRRLSVFRTH